MFLSALEYHIVHLTWAFHIGGTTPSLFPLIILHPAANEVLAVLRSGLLCQKHCAAWEHRTVPKARGSRLRPELYQICQMNSNDNSARVEWTWQDMTRQDKTWGQSSSILSVVFCCRVILVCTAKGQNLESSLIQQTQESCLVQPAAEYYILQVSGSFRNTWTNFVPAALPCLVKSRQSAAKAWPGKSGWQWNQVQNESQKVVKR